MYPHCGLCLGSGTVNQDFVRTSLEIPLPYGRVVLWRLSGCLDPAQSVGEGHPALSGWMGLQESLVVCALSIGEYGEGGWGVHRSHCG